jgi:hypothetical protein
MDRGRSACLFLAFLLVSPIFGLLTGCGKSTADQVAEVASEGADDETAATPSTPEPADAADVIHSFLTAIQKGDETTSNDLLTPLARQKTAEMDMAVAPIGSESASFTVGEVELPEEGAGELAHVVSTWTDIDDDGQPHTDEILWVLRHEEQGWRIAGMATKVFEDQPPLLLNFEDPVDMRRKQQLAEAEIERRAREAAAAQPEVSEDDQQPEAIVARPQPTQRQATKATRPKRTN